MEVVRASPPRVWLAYSTVMLTLADFMRHAVLTIEAVGSFSFSRLACLRAKSDESLGLNIFPNITLYLSIEMSGMLTSKS